MARSAATPTRTDAGRAWYRQPVLWLGALLLAGSLGGCIWMIVLGVQNADEAVPTGERVFKVPTAQPPPAQATPR
ncbi:hypothetical protein [Dokdonella sp.]|uniref:hypothetical protein n=1 Tax=Dokdonella sp. TaxID=2291710 RepID=UPI001B22741F|nr:hypothetical protein [Dokdonella sp.]MBO9663014.1 hypothetical protein [Dokdonella sp.]